MTRYFDANALAKRYLEEAGSTAVLSAIEDGLVVTSRLSYVEVCSALARRARERRLSRLDALRLAEAMHTDFELFHVVELSSEVASLARDLLLTRLLRASDAVQLASGLYVQRSLGRAIEFVCFDDGLSAVARAEGLSVTRLGS